MSRWTIHVESRTRRNVGILQVWWIRSCMVCLSSVLSLPLCRTSMTISSSSSKTMEVEWQERVAPGQDQVVSAGFTLGARASVTPRPTASRLSQILAITVSLCHHLPRWAHAKVKKASTGSTSPWRHRVSPCREPATVPVHRRSDVARWLLREEGRESRWSG